MPSDGAIDDETLSAPIPILSVNRSRGRQGNAATMHGDDAGSRYKVRGTEYGSQSEPGMTKSAVWDDAPLRLDGES